MTLRLSSQNAMINNSAETQKHPPSIGVLEGLGYTLVPVASLDILHANPYLAKGDYCLRELADGGRYDVVLSGPNTMLATGQYPRPPLGPVFRNGGIEAAGHRKAISRGVVAVLRDGTVVMARADGIKGHELQNRFGQKGNPMVSAIGGGIVLVEKGRKVAERDLSIVQVVGTSRSGFQARCMLAGVHTIMGIRKGRAYAAWCTSRSALDIQRDFYEFNFSCVIKFASGSGVFFDDCVDRLNGHNPTGFGVTRAY